MASLIRSRLALTIFSISLGIGSAIGVSLETLHELTSTAVELIPAKKVLRFKTNEVAATDLLTYVLFRQQVQIFGICKYAFGYFHCDHNRLR